MLLLKNDSVFSYYLDHEKAWNSFQSTDLK